ncbi:hypothetical protein B2G71_12875 [Novosphingobium sp. PC22D]|nr:hypothetical protein B2G71_12875 [Novosphingobium sp. PC22D]
MPWGGARRLPRAPSEVLTDCACRRLVHAVEQAAREGKPMTHRYDISWEHAGVAEKDVTAATRAFLKRAADWMGPYDGKLYWIYVHERGETHGAHVHMLLHLRPDLATYFRKAARRWIRSILPGGRNVKGTLKVQVLRGAMTPDEVSNDLYRSDLYGRVHYMLKHGSPITEVALGLHRFAFPGTTWGRRSTVYGRRAGWWQERTIRNAAK